jgi:hypothetical protein
MAWAAAWLYKATGRSHYLREAVKYWKKRYWDMTIGWDNSGAATAVMLHTLKEQGVRVPSSSRIKRYVEKKFLRSWIDSNGASWSSLISKNVDFTIAKSLHYLFARSDSTDFVAFPSCWQESMKS